MLTASRERGVIGGREIDAQHPEDRGQEALGLTQRSVEEETERQGGFDGEIGILELPAPPADASRCPRGDRVGREPEGDVASPHEGSVVLGPVPDAIRCRVLRMHARLHIEIMTRRRSRWSTCRPLLAHRAESAHQRPPPLPRCWIRQHRGTQGRARQPLKCAVFGCHEWEIYSCHQQGSLDVSVLSSIRKGSIPACAGEPRRSAPSPLRDRVHPRVCGGARPLTETVTPVVGPSPRVRGSRAADSRSRCGRGSIPACAGEPRQPRPGSGARWVHPRVCGGAPGSRSLRTPRPGPSPRVRGSHFLLHCTRVATGSIPACAGEPRLALCARLGRRVHPRVCGGAAEIPRANR